MISELDKVRITRFRLEMEAADELRLPPYKGSTFRGAFGNTFKKTVCVKRDMDCASCLIRERCVYYYVFETPATEEENRGYDFAPHPFLIEPPEERREVYERGALLSIGLVLIGRAIDYLPYFIYAFDEMGQTGIGQGRGKAKLLRVHHHSSEGERCIFTAGDQQLDRRFSTAPTYTPSKNAVERVRLRFCTPTRIKHNGRHVNRVDFQLLIRTLLRRSSDLIRHHCGSEMQLDFVDWIDRAAHIQSTSSDLQWQDWERYSHRQGRKIQMGGIVGEVTFAGDLSPFMPLLHLGTQIHLGKGTVFGMGRYEIA